MITTLRLSVRGLIIVVVVVLLSSFFSFCRVEAQGITAEFVGGSRYGDFVVGPGKIDLPLAPGESKTIELLVTNRIGERRQFNLEIEDAAGSTDPEIPIVLLGDQEGPYTLRDYISVPAASFELDSGYRARIPVTVQIPPDAEPGGRYGSVLVTTTSVSSGPEFASNAVPTSAIISRIGTLFFVTTPGDIAYAGALESFTTIPDRSVFSSGPVKFSILYENTGSVHVNPSGTISIKNILGDEVGFVELDPWYAMPQSLRFREGVWERQFLFGRYTAELELHRGYDDQIDYAQVTFWVLPWQIVLPILGSIVLFILLVRFVSTSFEFRRKS